MWGTPYPFYKANPIYLKFTGLWIEYDEGVCAMKSIYLAGGCFWGAEKYLALIPGVVQTEVGYANGYTENPTYEEVCSHSSGHAETVQVVYDPERLSLTALLDWYYAVIDPTSRNRQGGDIGTQYRTGVYYSDPADLDIIRASLAELQTKVKKPVVIEVEALENYYPAEDYHQQYLDKNPGGYCHIGSEDFAQVRAAKTP
jgi:peptide methionine sulfoxide reductase msrA/msrB